MDRTLEEVLVAGILAEEVEDSLVEVDMLIPLAEIGVDSMLVEALYSNLLLLLLGHCILLCCRFLRE